MSTSTQRDRSFGGATLRADVRIRQMVDGDLPRVRELRSVVGWYAEPEAFDLLRGMREARWAVAESSGGVIQGMVGAVPLGGIGILCHLAVRDERRRLGLGASLTLWALAYLKSRGARKIRLYTTSRAEKLYRSLGFEPGEKRVIYRLEGLEEGESENGRENGRENAGGYRSDGYRVEALRFGDLPELYGLDRWTYGADRSHLIFSTLRLHPGRGLVARDSSGRMKGYLIRSLSRGETRIGPLAAANEVVARPLLAEAVASGEGSLRATVPGESPAHELFTELGFSGSEDRLRMELRGSESPETPGLYQYATTAYLAT